MAPMTVETEPLADQQVDQQVEETEVRIFDGDDEADRPATNPVDETGAGPITAEELSDGATAQPESQAVSPGTEAAAETTADTKSIICRVEIHKNADAAATLAKIAEAETKVRASQNRIAEIKNDLKDAKEDYEAAINRLCRLSRQVANDASRPLLLAAEANENGKAESSSTNSLGDTTAAGDESQHETQELAPSPSASSASPANAGDWRAYRFDDSNHFPSLASQKAIVAKLAENGIETIGQMVDYQKPSESGWCKAITDIKGIGKGKAEKIENALETFWAEHPNIVQAAVDAS